MRLLNSSFYPYGQHAEILYPACRCKSDQSQTSEQVYKAFRSRARALLLIEAGGLHDRINVMFASMCICFVLILWS